MKEDATGILYPPSKWLWTRQNSCMKRLRNIMWCIIC